MVFYVLLVTCIALSIWCYLVDRSDDSYWIKKNIPFVPRRHIFGMLSNYFFGNACMSKIYKDIYEKYPDEPHVGMFLGAQPALLIRDPENIKFILKDNFQSFHSRGLIHNSGDKLTNNIFFMDEFKTWKLVRSKCSAMSCDYRLRYVFLYIDRCAQDFVRFLDDNQLSRKLNFNVLYRYASSVIESCVFVDENKKTSMYSKYETMSKNVSNPSFFFNTKLFIGYVFPLIFKLLRMKLYGAYENVFISIYKSEVKRRLHEKIRNFDFIDVCANIQDRGYMQDAVLAFELYPTGELMAAQAFIFFLCGTDATAQALNFALLELSNNPEVLVKLHKEIDAVHDKCNGNLSYDEVHHMWYLEMFVNETLRKYPPIGVIQRKCTKKTVLPVGDLEVDEGVVVVIPVYGIHRDEKYYPDPERFDPERFQSIFMERDHKMTYLAFGEGYRFCFGARLARLQIKAALVRLLRKYTIVPHIGSPSKLEKSLFGLRSTKNMFTLMVREIPNKKEKKRPTYQKINK